MSTRTLVIETKRKHATFTAVSAAAYQVRNKGVLTPNTTSKLRAAVVAAIEAIGVLMRFLLCFLIKKQIQ